MNSNLNIIFFKGVLETLDYFVNELFDAAKNLNIECYMADVKEPESFGGEAFYDFIQRDNCIFITFNQIGIQLYDSDDNNVWEKYNIPIYDFMVDHPRNYVTTLDNPPNTLHVICIDKNHQRYIEDFYPKVKKVSFCAHGGTEESKIKLYEERKIDVLYVGSCQPEVTSFPVIGVLQDGGKELYGVVISMLIRNHTLTVEQAITEYLLYQNCKLNKKQILEIYDISALHIETYIRRYYKQIAMKELDKLGVNVVIYGDNWKANDYTFGSNIIINDRITSRRCNELAGDAKICLNFMPWFKNGTSERVFNAMLNKSVCVSDTSVYLQERFTDGENIVYFDLDNPLQMAYDIKFLLDNPKVAQRIAQNGYEIAKKQCTWKQRLIEIIGIHCDR